MILNYFHGLDHTLNRVPPGGGILTTQIETKKIRGDSGTLDSQYAQVKPNNDFRQSQVVGSFGREFPHPPPPPRCDVQYNLTWSGY